MTSPSLDLRPLDGFAGYRFIRPPVSDDKRLFGVQTSGVVLALEHDGKTAWQRPTTRPWPPLASRVAAAVRGRALLVSDEEWTALELSTGSMRWHAKIESDLTGPAFDSGHVWAYHVNPQARQISLVEVSLIDGSTRTLRQTQSWGDVLAVTDNAVIALEKTTLTSFDLSGGTERWTVTLERPSCEPGRNQAIALEYAHKQGQRLLVPLMGYGFVAIDLHTGNVAWDADLRVVGMASVLAGDRLHVQSAWRFIELDTTTGAVVSDVEITDPEERRKTFAPGPLVHHAGVLYAANRDGTVFGWDIAARRLVWSHAAGTRVEWSCPPRIFLDALWIMDAEGKLHPFELP